MFAVHRLRNFSVECRYRIKNAITISTVLPRCIYLLRGITVQFSLSPRLIPRLLPIIGNSGNTAITYCGITAIFNYRLVL